MQAGRPSPIGAAVEQVAFDSLLVAVDELGRQASDSAAYSRELLPVVLRDGPFHSVALWSVDEAGSVLKGSAPEGRTVAPIPESARSQALSGQAFEASGAAPDSNGGSHHFKRLFAGSRIHGSEGILLEATLDAAAPSERPMRLLEALAELIGHTETRLRYGALKSAAAGGGSTDRIALSFHQGQSIAETGLLIAAGLQEALNDDRCWVCHARHGRCRIVATSAPGDVARRQTLAKNVEQVADAALASGRGLVWSAGETGTPEIIALAEEGMARRISAFPLVPPGQDSAVGVAVLERFSAAVDQEEAARRQPLLLHAAVALSRAAETRHGWQRLMPQDASGWWGRGAAALAMMAAVIFLAMPVPFEVEAEGRLQPTTIRSVFAPADGVVSTIHVRHGQEVASEAPLIDLRSPELELDREKIAGQISELSAKLASIQLLRAQGRTTAGESASDLSAQEEQLRAALKGAEEQRTLIAAQMQRLSLRSPLTGVVDRWDLTDALDSRPVVRGQYLCDVLDVSGPWMLDLRIPDKSVGIVSAASRAGAALPVRFVLRTDPQTEYGTTLSEVGERTQIDESGQLHVRATAAIPPDSPLARRVGASVLARIDCGRRSRGYVWFHELWNFLALQLL